MAAFIRCGRLLVCNLGRTLSKSVHVNYYKHTNLPLHCSRSFAKAAGNKQTLPANLNETIDNGFISRHLFSSLISSFEDKAEVTESNMAMLFYICCSGPFDASINDRLLMVDEIWNRLDEFGVQPTTKLYNMKLKAYCANRKKFVPRDELAAMKSLGLNPDKVTYSLLIEGFNQNGDVTGANYVLEAMKDANLNIGVSTFNSFITGHLKSGSLEEADITLEVMRSRGLLPNVDTYLRYAEFYANEGDGDKVMEYIKNAQENDTPMDKAILMNLYRHMLLSGHKNEAEKMLSLLTDDFFHVSSMHRLCHLVSEGFSDEAFNLYLTIPKSAARKDLPNAGCFLLHSMIINGKDAGAVVEMADKLLEANPSSTPHRYALFYAYKHKLTDQALSILKSLSSKNHSLKTAHFIPAICQYRNSENLEGLYEVIAMLNNTERIDLLDYMATMSAYCYPALTKLGQSREDIVTKMKEHEGQWNTFFLIEDLKVTSCMEALGNVKGKMLDEKTLQYLKWRWSLLRRHLPGEWESCIKLLAKLTGYNKSFRHFVASVVVTVLEEGDRETAEQMFELIKKEKLRLYKEELGDKNCITNLPPDIQTMLQKLLESQFKVTPKKFEPISMKEMMSKTVEEIETYLKKNPHYRLARVVLLKKYLEKKDLLAAQQKLRELEASGFTFPRHELVSLISMLTELGDTESAVPYMKNLKETSGTNYPDRIPLKLAVALLQVANVEEALTMINLATLSQMPTTPGRDKSRREIVMNLLQNAPTIKDAETIHKLLVDAKGFLSLPETSIAHRHYIKKALTSDIDDEDFLQLLEKLHEEYWVLPCMDEIITRYIEKEKKSYLKRVIDIGVSVVGGNLFYHKLACNLVGCGLPEKATIIFQSLKDKLNEKVIITSCRHFISKKEVDCVESLVNITKTFSINRGLMLSQLIEAYVGVDDMNKAIDVLQMFHDENILPPKAVLNFMSVALETRKLETPTELTTLLDQIQKADKIETGQQEILPLSDSSSSSNSEVSDEEVMITGDANMSTTTNPVSTNPKS